MGASGAPGQAVAYNNTWKQYYHIASLYTHRTKVYTNNLEEQFVELGLGIVVHKSKL